jgi:REP element-mobilizing transposase RayT
MPSQNTRKYYLAHNFYHVYNRGWNHTEIFPRTEDYEYLEYLIARCLAPEPSKDSQGREHVWLSDAMQLNAYCLMPNHYHFLLYQHDDTAVAKFIQSIFTAYTRYFNKKYQRQGPLFESRFKAVAMHNDGQLQHISRYIHLNHWDYDAWQFSSYGDYIDVQHAREWLQPEPILELFDSVEQYRDFVASYYELQRANERAKKWQRKI